MIEEELDPQAGSQDVEEQPDQYEAEAKEYGWKPESEMPEGTNHMDAEAFMLHGPGTSRKLGRELVAEKKARVDAEEGLNARMERYEAAQRAGENARVEARAIELEAAKRAAAEDGDMENYDKLANVKPAKAPAETIPHDDRVKIEAWMKDNTWFSDDPIANSDAIQYYNAFTANGANTADALVKVTDRMKLKSPYLFPEEPKARKAASVDGGGLPSRKSTKKGWTDIPSEDRQLVTKQIDRGEWNDLATTMKTTAKEAYAAAYWEQ